MNIVIKAWSHSGIVVKSIKKYIEQLKITFLGTDLSLTLNVHIIFEHITQSLEYLEGRGLRIYSEQSGESIHHHFTDRFWKKYKINRLDNQRHSDALLHALVECNSKALGCSFQLFFYNFL